MVVVEEVRVFVSWNEVAPLSAGATLEILEARGKRYRIRVKMSSLQKVSAGLDTVTFLVKKNETFYFFEPTVGRHWVRLARIEESRVTVLHGIQKKRNRRSPRISIKYRGSIKHLG
jgi:hypothetical protein